MLGASLFGLILPAYLSKFADGVEAQFEKVNEENIQAYKNAHNSEISETSA